MSRATADDGPQYPRHARHGARSGDMAGHSITWIFWRQRKSVTICATWGLSLSCCNIMIRAWPQTKGKTCCLRTSFRYHCPFNLPSRMTSGGRPCAEMSPPPPTMTTGLYLWWFCDHCSCARWWQGSNNGRTQGLQGQMTCACRQFCTVIPLIRCSPGSGFGSLVAHEDNHPLKIKCGYLARQIPP